MERGKAIWVLVDGKGCLLTHVNPKAWATRAHAKSVLSLLKAQGCNGYRVEQYVQKPKPQRTDGPIYNSGRHEGRADMCAELRRILDPEDTNHWNGDGLLARVRLLAAMEHDERGEKDEK